MADPAVPIPVPPNVEEYTAPQLFAVIFVWMLFGFVASQTYHYYMNFKDDPPAIKALVYGIFTVDVVHTALVARDMFMTLARGWGNTDALFNAQLFWVTGAIIPAIIGTLVQCFYGWRIFKLTKSRVLTGAIVLLSLGSFTAGIGTGIISSVPNDAEIAKRVFKWTTSFGALSVACDSLINMTMIVWFLTIRSNIRYGATSEVLIRILKFTVVSGLLTTTVQIIAMITALTDQAGQNFYFQCPSVVIEKVFANSLLAMLNQRHRVREGGTTRYLYETDINSTPTARGRNEWPIFMNSAGHGGSNTIQVTTTIDRHEDTAKPAAIELDSLQNDGADTDAYQHYNKMKGSGNSLVPV